MFSNSCFSALYLFLLGKVPAPIPATVTVGAPTAARVLLKQRSEDPSIGRSSASTGLATGSPTSPSEDASVVGRGAGTAGGEAEDDHSDKGTYTIELENRNPEEEEARRMIDKVGVLNDVSNHLHHFFLPQPSQYFVLIPTLVNTCNPTNITERPFVVLITDCS